MGNDRVQELESELASEKQERADADGRAMRAKERAREADEAYQKLQLDLVTAKDEASTARDDAKRLEEKLAALEADLAKLREAAAAPKAPSVMPPPKASAPPPPQVTGPPPPKGSARPPPQVTGPPPPKGSAPPPPQGSVPPPKGSALPPPVIITIADPAGGAQLEMMLERIAGLREMLAGASIELSQLHADEVAMNKKRSRVLADACAILARAVGATGQAPPPIPSAALEARLSMMAPVIDISEVADLIESLRPPRAPKVE